MAVIPFSHLVLDGFGEDDFAGQIRGSNDDVLATVVDRLKRNGRIEFDGSRPSITSRRLRRFFGVRN